MYSSFIIGSLNFFNKIIKDGNIQKNSYIRLKIGYSHFLNSVSKSTNSIL